MDNFDRNRLRSLLQDERFRAVERVKSMVLEMYKEQEVKADTEFETLWRTAQKEAKIQGLKDFFNKLIEEASKADD